MDFEPRNVGIPLFSEILSAPSYYLIQFKLKIVCYYLYRLYTDQILILLCEIILLLKFLYSH